MGWSRDLFLIILILIITAGTKWRRESLSRALLAVFLSEMVLDPRQQES